MAVSFSFYGHPNIQALHRTTFEFTKDAQLSKNGDCIIGVKADFSLAKLKKFIKDKEIIIVNIIVGDLREEITALVNKSFNDEHEIVIRLGEHPSERTLGLRADKAAVHINRELIKRLKDSDVVGKVEIR